MSIIFLRQEFLKWGTNFRGNIVDGANVLLEQQERRWLFAMSN